MRVFFHMNDFFYIYGLDWRCLPGGGFTRISSQKFYVQIYSL